MDHKFCPGSKVMRQPVPEIFACPQCGEEVEIWSDELKRSCPKCHKMVFRDTMMSCLDWCEYGEECVGGSVFNTYMDNRAAGIKKTLIDELEKLLQDEDDRIDLALEIMQNAESLAGEKKADRHILLPASLLYILADDPERLRKILLRTGMKIKDIDEIGSVIDNVHRRVLESAGNSEEEQEESANLDTLFEAVNLSVTTRVRTE